jgi:putative tricarboxylic transport membrane protein
VGVAGCGNDVNDVGANWPRRDLKIMAPAGPGGGWDTTAREMARVMERQNVIDKSVEVYNVSGAGGTIGRSQLASKRGRVGPREQ